MTTQSNFVHFLSSNNNKNNRGDYSDDNNIKASDKQLIDAFVTR